MDKYGKKICPALFHVIYPYAHTILSGGWFSWVRKDDGVIAQCPQGVVRVKISADEVEVIEGKCVDHEPGDVFLLSEFKAGCVGQSSR